MSDMEKSDSYRIERMVDARAQIVDDEASERQKSPLRPQSFSEYPGQEFVKENLRVYVQAAKQRGKALDHVILHGPPGLGKTTLAHIVANELGVAFQATSAPAIDKAGDLAGILTSLSENAVLFIDEIHRLPIHIEEVLYAAMEDFSIDIVIGSGPTARTINMDIAPFTLIGATTKLSLLSRPFLNRFGIQEKLDFYDVDALVAILLRSARILGVSLEEDAAKELACRCRGTPRIANRLLRRALDFAEVRGNGRSIDGSCVHIALDRLKIDASGLDQMDRQILSMIQERYEGGPVGVEALSVSLGEERATIEDVYEPYLVHQGFLTRGPRGRSITSLGRQHLARKEG